MKKLIPLMFLVIFSITIFISFTSAQIFKQNDLIDLKLLCINNGTFCSDGKCNVTILYPNNSILANNLLMTNQYSIYNYTLQNSNVIGSYFCSVTCCDGIFCSTNSCDFNITPSGLESNVANALYYFGILLMFTLFFIGNIYLIWKVNKPWLKLLFVCIAYLTFIALTFVCWQVSVNFISTIPFVQTILYFTWVIGLICFLPFIFIAGLWLMDLASKEAGVKQKIGMGYSEDEARNGYK